VAIATNSGFAASADRPLMSEDEQRAKLRLVETAARYYWGNEIRPFRILSNRSLLMGAGGARLGPAPGPAVVNAKP
jgi:hypothetical protein